HHLFNSFCDFIARRARQRAILVILEDLHWADDSTLSLLGHLAQRLSTLPILAVATYRDLEPNASPGLAKTLADLLRRRLTTAIRLAALQHDEIAQMLRSLSGRVPPVAVVNEVYRETGGNPFFIEELFHHLEEENRLYDANGSFHTELRIAETDVPPSV